MRRSREEAKETRRAVLAAAARLFRERGIATVSVADIMGSLGLTVGGFYRHFPSKQALVSEAIDAASREATRDLQERMRTATPARRASALRQGYLSDSHRAHTDTGCPVAALCSEMGHEDRGTREAFARALQRLIGVVESAEPGKPVKRRESLATTAMFVGALVLARATDDKALAQELLTAARDAPAGRAGPSSRASASASRARASRNAGR